jgi:predicted SAM-dependent methyltransferase
VACPACSIGSAATARSRGSEPDRRCRAGRRAQLAFTRFEGRTYLDVGCGIHAQRDPEWVNLDYDWFPGIDLCWDITRGLPVPSAHFRGVYSEHCLEHVTLAQAREVLAEIHRVLLPGGDVRLVVPDVVLYLRAFERAKAGEPNPFPHQEGPDPTPMMTLNRVYYDYGHRYAYDESTLAAVLADAGFERIARASNREGRDPRLLIDREERAAGSLYMEASKPA